MSNGVLLDTQTPITCDTTIKSQLKGLFQSVTSPYSIHTVFTRV